MHWSQHHRHSSATHLQTTVNDPFTSPSGQTPQLGPSQEVSVSVLSAALCAPFVSASPGLLRTHSTSWSCSRGRDEPPGGCKSKGPTSMPGHYSKQKASPGRLCSNQAAVNETIYCAPINVQPQDPRTASPIVLSVLIKAGSSRHLQPLQLEQSGSNSEERDGEFHLWSSVQNKEHLLPRRLVPTAERRMETISVPSPVLHKHCQC